MATITELLKNKEYHRLSAILFALQTQTDIDNKEFAQRKIMRCWECLEIMDGEIAAIKKRMDEIEKEAL